MLDERYYVQQVNKLMDELRAACLGQDTPLIEVLPARLKTALPDKQAAQLAEQVLFALVRAFSGKNHTPQELHRCRIWLRGSARYLLEECSGEDHTFAQWKKLMELPRGARMIVFTNFDDPSAQELKNGDSPSLLKEFDAAVWRLLKVRCLSEEALVVYRQLADK